MGGVKCQPFLKHSNHWKRALKMIFKGSGCFQFPEGAPAAQFLGGFCLIERQTPS